MATLPGLLASRFLAFILHVVVLILCLCLQEQNIKTLKGTLAESGQQFITCSIFDSKYVKCAFKPTEFESERLDYTFRIQIATTILFSLFLVEFTELFTGIFVHRHSLSLLSKLYLCMHACMHRHAPYNVRQSSELFSTFLVIICMRQVSVST